MAWTTWVIIVAWAAFILYWIFSAFGVKKDITAGNPWVRWGFLRLVIAIALAIIISQNLLGIRHIAGDGLIFWHNPALNLVGAIFTAAGVAFAIWARWHLGRNWSPHPAIKEHHELVTSGPYRFVRHPIYTGMLLAALGSAFAIGWPWVIVFIIVSIVFVWRIHTEERFMMQLFPDQYPAYRARTKALIPFIW